MSDRFSRTVDRPIPSVKTMAASLFWAGLVSLVVFCVVRPVLGLERNTATAGAFQPLRNAASPEAVILAIDAILIAADRESLTSGSTSITTKIDNEDFGIWYQGLREARETVLLLPKTASLTDQESVLHVVRNYRSPPEGHSVFPYNKIVAFWGLFSLISACLGAIVWVVIDQTRYE